ncbi:MAG TPA: hypothetical protein VE987_10035 [Polyangiaceae bacterium]|nr:hypothetical protein [Polyangiaceae bacterium]
MASARKTDQARVEGDELFDVDVPAAVVCAQCGDADCPGCFQEQTRSGVVAVVAWERPGAGAFTRLWLTARAATVDAERFFDALPDGPLAPALRFALICELMASSAMAALLFVPLALLAPGWCKQLLLGDNPLAARIVAIGVPGLAALLVAAHVAHGWALDVGARRAGARGATNRALRFGLYSAGWDLVVGPLGAFLLAGKEGARAASSLLGLGIGLPGRSARAFLRGCYGLEGASAGPAMRASYVAAAAATAVGAVAVIVAIVVVLLG